MAKQNKSIHKRPWFSKHIFAHFDFDKDNSQLKAASKLDIAENYLLEGSILSLCNEQERIIHLLSQIDDEHLQWEISRSIDNIFIDSRIIGKFTEPLSFIKKQADETRTKRARAAKNKTVIERRELIKAHYKGKLTKSPACAKRIISQLKDSFVAAGIKRFSDRTIIDDIDAILSVSHDF